MVRYITINLSHTVLHSLMLTSAEEILSGHLKHRICVSNRQFHFNALPAVKVTDTSYLRFPRQ